jgi:hypothetical protein
MDTNPCSVSWLILSSKIPARMKPQSTTKP